MPVESNLTPETVPSPELEPQTEQKPSLFDPSQPIEQVAKLEQQPEAPPPKQPTKRAKAKTEAQIHPAEKVRENAELSEESRGLVIKRGGQWVKGTASPNPTGRPALVRDVVALARKQTVQAIRTLTEIMGDRDCSADSRIKAAVALLDRGYGKAPQFVSVVSHLNGNEIEEAARRILLRRQKARKVDAKVVDAELEEKDPDD